MNCCSEFGNCTQGRDCPVRTGKVLPHQAEHAAQVAPIKSTRPHWMDGGSLPSAEAGNFYLPPATDDDMGLGWLGTSLLVFWLTYIVFMVWLMILLGGWLYESYAPVLWAWLASVS